MKILFIYPNTASQLGFNYGVAHMSSILKEAGHEVEFWQLCKRLKELPPEAEFIRDIRKSSPDIVGFSVVTNQWSLANKLAAWTGKATDVPRICGGIHASVATEEVLRSGNFEYAFSGECEDAFLDFVERYSAGQDVTEVSNLSWNNEEGIHTNPVRVLPDLSVLPPKDYEIFDFQRIIDAKNGWVGLMASRGCPFKCSYCFNHFMVSKYRNDLNCSFKELNYIRHFPIPQIIDEIKYLENNYQHISMYIFDHSCPKQHSANRG